MGTTGSGRELIAEFVGADAVNDEITAHKTGAIHISSTLGGEPVDTIFEIGGQDSKFISIENGVVVDFAMNEACAAGTGSFLEEQAEKLGISIKGEFAKLALGVAAPTRLGERCTVFMERDVTGWLHKGETVPNLVAGLAYSIALNYLNRVVRGRKIGKVIYFQGGTAYNDAVTAAFASLLGKKITVPPYNGVMGAIGMALIARQWHQATGAQDPLPRLRPAQAAAFHARFRLQGLLQPLRHEGVRHRGAEELLGRQVLRQVPQAFGHRPQAGDRRPVRATASSCSRRCPAVRGSQLQVGLPRAMSMLDRLPFWKRYFAELGIETGALAGDRSADFGRGHRPGGGAAVLPGAGGARARAGAGGCGRGLRPAAEYGGRRRPSEGDCASHYCPWNQTLPWVLRVGARRWSRTSTSS